MALDDEGAIHVTGRMASLDLSTTAGVMQPMYGGGGMDAFLIRYEADGTLDYATYVGGNSYDVGYGISLDDTGAVYLSGRTSSTTLPVTGGSYQPDYAGGSMSAPYFGGDFFGIKIEADGTDVVWGTFAGGGADDMGRGRNFVDAQGALWIGGRTLSADFPTTPGALSGSRQGQSDGGVVRISADGGSLLYGTYLGGAQGTNDAATGGLLVLPNGEALVCGYVTAPDFPIPGNAAQPAHGGGSDGFVVRLSADGSQILAGTFLGGSGYEECQGVAVDDAGNVYVIGLTASNDFPTTPGAFQPDFGGDTDLWIMGLSPDLQTRIFSTYVGGDGDDTADSSRVWVDPEGQVVMVGNAGNGNAPVTADAAQPDYGGGPHDAYVVRLSSDGSTMLYGSFLGGDGDDFARSVAIHAP